MEAFFNEFKNGFFEPFAEDINGDINAFYADDFTVMVNKSLSKKIKKIIVLKEYMIKYDNNENKWSFF